jgi:hypothetical protein
MSSMRLIAAATGLALCWAFPAYATEAMNEMVPGESARGFSRLAQERPFGGPLPPRKRSLEKAPRGKACKTPAMTCKLQDAQPVGDACSCPGSDGKPVTGTVVEHPG